MSNSDIKKIISDIYQADINSIRNLSKLANDLTQHGKLVVPGGLEIKGRLTVNGPTNLNGGTNVKAETNFWKPVAFKNQKSSGWSYINHARGHCSIAVPFYAWKTSQLRGNVTMEGNVTMGRNLRVNGNVGIRRGAHPKIALIVNGRGLVHSIETVSAGIYCDKNLQVTGNVGIRRAPHPKVGLIVDGSGRSVGIETNTTMKSANRDVIRHGDGVYIKRGSTWLNSTSSGSGSRGSLWSGWTYWRGRHDADSNLNIFKR